MICSRRLASSTKVSGHLERTRDRCPIALPRAMKAEARSPQRTEFYRNLRSFIGGASASKGQCQPPTSPHEEHHTLEEMNIPRCLYERHRCAGDVHGRDFPFGGECLHPNQDNPMNREELGERIAGSSRSAAARSEFAALRQTGPHLIHFRVPLLSATNDKTSATGAKPRPIASIIIPRSLATST
jgi:hypothetical protein